jgi:hypothetical protein
MFVYVDVYVDIHVCLCIHIYTYRYINTHTCCIIYHVCLYIDGGPGRGHPPLVVGHAHHLSLSLFLSLILSLILSFSLSFSHSLSLSLSHSLSLILSFSHSLIYDTHGHWEGQARLYTTIHTLVGRSVCLSVWLAGYTNSNMYM